MILLDTNVVSETMRAIPDQRVLHWLDSLDEREAGIPSVVLAELYYGLNLMADGRRKEGIRLALDSLANDLYQGRIVPFDNIAARHYGQLMAGRELSGRQMRILDAQIAAIALANNAQLATRDSDFAHCGIEIINPWAVA
jgi:predicted nucleic acid-binding protein